MLNRPVPQTHQALPLADLPLVERRLLQVELLRRVLLLLNRLRLRL